MIHDRLSGPPATPDDKTGLTRRELEILRFIAISVNTKTAAEKLHVSPATVRNHGQRRAMLSRAQEARVRDVLGWHPPGTIQTQVQITVLLHSRL